MSTVRLRLAIAGLVALVAALALTACGGGSETTTTAAAGPDPATATPADSVMYAEASVRPQGTQSDAVNGVLEKLLGTSDVGSVVTQAVDKELQAQHTKLTYENDISPWLGSRAAIFFNKIASGSASEGAIVVATTDPQAASQTAAEVVEQSPHGGAVHSANYRGVDYSTQGSGAFGVVGNFLVAGTLDGFKAAVDTVKDGDSLASSSPYASAIASAPSDRLATVWVDPKSFLAALVKYGSLGANALDFAHLLQSAPLQPIVGWADATPSTVGFEVSTPAAKPTTSQSLITGFPADSWLAFGAHGIGAGLVQGLQTLNSLPAGALGGLSPGAALARIKRLTGLDLPSFAKWLDDVSGYVAGSSIFSLGGAVVLSSHDQSASANTLNEIEGILRHDVDLSVSPLSAGRIGFTVRPQSAPIQITVEQQGDKVVAGLGSNPADQALSPSSSLGDSSAFKSAEGALGSDLTPSFYLDFAPLGAFLTLPGAAGDPQIEQAKPYLSRLDYVIAGSGVSNGRQLSRIVLGVKDGSGSTGDVTAAIPAP